MAISDEAVEAAVKAWDHYWGDRYGDEALEEMGEEVRVALEAAAPFIRQPQQVTTVEEIDALPVGTIILDSDPDALLKTDYGTWRSLSDPEEPFKSLYLSLPATVLHVGAP